MRRHLRGLLRKWRAVNRIRIPRKPVPGWLQKLLREHRDQFAPQFDGYLSDHLPMAALSMWHLRRPRWAIERWAAAYQQKLEPPQDGSYATACAAIDLQIARQGVAATVRDTLPPLLSGWVTDAFHPIIRLAFGMQFQVTSEVSAGLAYLSQLGPEPLLAQYAESAEHRAQLQWPAFQSTGPGTFSQKAREFLRSPAPPPVVYGSETLSRYAQEALQVMLATEDFFALHLVTGLDAFRVATAPLTDNCDHWLAAGLLTGYAAAQITLPGSASGQQHRPAVHTDTEHDFKVIVALQGLAAACGDSAFSRAAHYAAIEVLKSQYGPT